MDRGTLSRGPKVENHKQIPLLSHQPGLDVRGRDREIQEASMYETLCAGISAGNEYRC